MYQVTTNAKPEAFITRKKSRVKIYQNNFVYFNDGELFEIELFNPKTNRILTKIWLNGQEISGSGIIINPGQRLFLERFIDSNNKFVYKTYDVENTNESLNAVRNNGDIEIMFFDEYFSVHNTYWYGSIPINPYVGGALTLSTSSGYVGSLSTNTSNVGISNKSIETGRVEKGESSNQSFTNGYGSFLSYASNTIKYKILPMSIKPIEGKDLKKYCTECGKSLKKEWKFCPCCGTEV